MSDQTKPDPIAILQSVFGFDHFLGEQENIIRHVLGGGDAVVLMPTGGGKSLCYQIPAMLRPGVGVVISPLIALMQDQVQGLTQMGVRAAALNSSLPPFEIQETEQRLLAGGEHGLDLIYVAPERLFMNSFQSLLRSIPLALFAIDEAHCVSQWGHDFRPEYTRLSILAEEFPDVPRMALTATADGPTRGDIIEHLRLNNARIFATGFDRPNIRYTIQPKDRPDRQLIRFIKAEHPGDAGIVYRMSRKKVEATAAKLQKEGFDALPYHAGLGAGVRQRHQDRFMNEEGIIMVATVAFGMGVDKPNVRFVAHLDPPQSLEAFHQETGRAGRDGLPADAWMVYGLQDIGILRQIISNDERSPRAPITTPAPADEPGAPVNMRHEYVKQQKLSALLGFCETPACRRQCLMRYFGEDYPEPCGNCDNCLNPPETWDATIDAQKALSCVYRTDQRFGVQHCISVLLGKDTKMISKWRHQKLSTYGIGADLDERHWRSVFRQLIASGYLHIDMENFGSLKLTQQSWDILKNNKSISFRRDPAVTKLPRESRKKRDRAGSPKKAPPAFEQVLATEESQTLWHSLKALRTKLSQEQGVPPYAVFPDRTLLDLIQHRPQTMEQMGSMHGVGRFKLQGYGQAFLDALMAHEAVHGRPDDLPEIEIKERPPQNTKRKKSLKGTAKESLALFRELGDIEAVARERDLKPSTVSKHLVDAVAWGEATVQECTGLDQDEITRIEQTIQHYQDKGAVSLTPVFEALEEKHPFDHIRMIRSAMRRRSS